MILTPTDAFLNTEEERKDHKMIFRNLHRHLMKNSSISLSSQSIHILSEPPVLAQATEWVIIANNFSLHSVSQSFQTDHYNKGKGNCQVPSVLFL